MRLISFPPRVVGPADMGLGRRLLRWVCGDTLSSRVLRTGRVDLQVLPFQDCFQGQFVIEHISIFKEKIIIHWTLGSGIWISFEMPMSAGGSIQACRQWSSLEACSQGQGYGENLVSFVGKQKKELDWTSQVGRVTISWF